MSKLSNSREAANCILCLNGQFSDIPGTAFLEYPEYLEEYMPWDPMVQKLCR